MAALVIFRKDRGRGEPIAVFCSVACRSNYAAQALVGVSSRKLGFGHDPEEHHSGESCDYCLKPLDGCCEYHNATCTDIEEACCMSCPTWTEK